MLSLVSVGSLGHLRERWWALILGTVSALVSGSFVVIVNAAAQDASTRSGRSPSSNDPRSLRRSETVFARLGLVVSTVISGYLTGAATKVQLGVLGQLAGYLIAVMLNVGLFVAAFRILTGREVSTATAQ